MDKSIICIACPRGCNLRITGSGGEMIIEGNACPKGLDYGRQEILQPLRMLTTTVKTTHPDCPRLPVRLSAEIPKAELRNCMKIINSFTAETDCCPGDIIAKNIFAGGIDLIATGALFYEA